MESSYGEGHFFDYTHVLGLAILGNILQAVVDDGDDESYHPGNVASGLDLTSSFWKRVTDHLLYDMKVATQRPNEAALSAKCIRLLNDVVRNGQMEHRQYKTLSPSKSCLAHAIQFGQQRHVSLQKECEDLMAMEIDDSPIHAH
jgi:hypothetical protein